MSIVFQWFDQSIRLSFSLKGKGARFELVHINDVFQLILVPYPMAVRRKLEN